tara:strand:+ start:1384 stop:1728 length:345 start_codon:yes stop_codon:yes gene_type:complete
MAKNVQVKNKVFNKEQLDKVLDRDFAFFVEPPVEEDTITVDEFFTAYDELYYEIPLKGETNSHEFLIKKSTELVGFEKDTADIQPLLDEIANLREQLLSQQEQIIDLTNQVASD